MNEKNKWKFFNIKIFFRSQSSLTKMNGNIEKTFKIFIQFQENGKGPDIIRVFVFEVNKIEKYEKMKNRLFIRKKLKREKKTLVKCF